MSAQTRLLQEGMLVRVGSCQPVALDVRVLAVIHVDLELAVAQGRFREDLYYRLDVLRLRMPALREREGDVELLAQHFPDAFRSQHHGRARGFNNGVRQAMRELLNRVQRAAVVTESSLISAVDLDLQAAPDVPSADASLDLTRVSAEREAVLNCLRESHYDISECARRFNVSHALPP